MCQTSYGSDAVRVVDDTKTAVLGAYYERVGKKRWAKRRRAAALLDQNPQYPYEPATLEQMLRLKGAGE